MQTTIETVIWDSTKCNEKIQVFSDIHLPINVGDSLYTSGSKVEMEVVRKCFHYFVDIGQHIRLNVYIKYKI